MRFRQSTDGKVASSYCLTLRDFEATIRLPSLRRSVELRLTSIRTTKHA